MAEQRAEEGGTGTGVEWIRRNQRALTMGVIALGAVALAAWFLVSTGQRKEAFAMQALERARDAVDAGNLPLAASELQGVVDTYRGTDAALEATLSLNVVRMTSGQHQLAADDLTRFLDGNPPSQFVGRAAMLLGAALENLGKPAEAASAYERAAETSELDFERADALLSAARAYQRAGNTEAAIQALRTVSDRFADTPKAAEARVRLGELTGGRSE